MLAARQALRGDRLRAPSRASRARTVSYRSRCAPASSTRRDDLGLRRQLGGHLVLGPAQQERAHAARQQRRAARSSPCFSIGVRNARAEASARRPAAPASGSRTATTVRPGGSRAACRSGTAGAARRSRQTPRVAFGCGVLDRLRLVEDHAGASACSRSASLVARQQRRRSSAPGRLSPICVEALVRGRRRAATAPAARARSARPRPASSAPALVGHDDQRRAGRAGRPRFSTRMCASVCTVLPRPMSSARMPPRSCSRRNCSQSRPCCW